MSKVLTLRVPEIDNKLLSRELAIRIHGRRFRIPMSKVILLTAVLTFTITFSVLTSLRHSYYLTFGGDLGIYLQSLWCTAYRGKFMYYQVEWWRVKNPCYFGVHFSPILLLILPIFTLIPRPETLLTIQALAVAIAAIPLYYLAKYLTNNDEYTATIVATLYLLNPVVHGCIWFDFHEQALFIPLMIALHYTLVRRKFRMYLLLLVLTLSTFEQVPIILIAYAVSVLWEFREEVVNYFLTRRVSKELIKYLTPLITLSAIWFVIAYTVMRMINPVVTKELLAVENFRVLGIKRSVFEIPIKVITDPNSAIKALCFDLPVKFMYLLILFGSTAAIPLTYPIHLIGSLPWLAVALLSNYRPYYQVGFQYSAIVVPFLFIALAHALAKLRKENRRKLIIILITATATFTLTTSPISPLVGPTRMGPGITFLTWSPQYELPFKYYHVDRINEALRGIKESENYSIMVPNHIFPHMCYSTRTYMIRPVLIDPLGYIRPGEFQKVLKYNNDLILRKLPRYVILDEVYDVHSTRWLVGYSVPLFTLYKLVKYIDGIYVFKLREITRTRLNTTTELIKLRTTLDYRIVKAEGLGTLLLDTVNKTKTVVTKHKVQRETTIARFALPRGNFTIKLLLKVDKPCILKLYSEKLNKTIAKVVIRTTENYAKYVLKLRVEKPQPVIQVIAESTTQHTVNLYLYKITIEGTAIAEVP